MEEFCFSVCRQLQVHRIAMHKNFLLSLFLNAVAVVLFKSLVIAQELTPGQASVLDLNGVSM